MHTKAPSPRPVQSKILRVRIHPDQVSAVETTNRPIVAVLVVAILAASVAILLWHSVRANDGHLVFALDDPYIHLSMARSLASDGVWGVVPSQFSATSSAPLYTLLMALAFLVGGSSEIWAWLFAITGGLAAAAVLANLISRQFPHTGAAVALSLLAVVITGLPELMFTGMEHTLHIFVVLMMAGVALSDTEGSRRSLKSDLLLATLVLIGCGLRYETLFLVPALLWHLMRSGRRFAAWMSGVAAILPGLVLGAVQVINGQMVLPNTLIMKSVIGYGDDLSYVSRFLSQIESSYLTALMVLVATGTFLSVYQRSDSRNNPRLLAAAMFLSGCVFHAAFARIDRRYVGYLLALGIVAAAPYAGEWLAKARVLMTGSEGNNGRARKVLGWVLLACIGVLPFTNRIVDLQRLPRLGRDVYVQQYQMARFFATEYSGQSVGLNDIGTTSWAGMNPVLDLWGLAEGEIARECLAGRWTVESIRRYVAETKTEIVAVYPNWYEGIGGLPREWIAVGSWDLFSGIQVNVAQPQVVFLATNQAAADHLKAHLNAFASTLPYGVAFTPYL